MQAVVSMSSSASWMSFIFHWSLGSFLVHLNLLLLLVMLLCDKVSKGLLFSFIFHFTSNATMTRKSQNTKAQYPCYVDHDDKDNVTDVGYFGHY